MPTTHTLSAKDRVITWVRSKCPQAVKHKCRHCDEELPDALCIYCGEYNTYSDEADMGLAELLIALKSLHPKPAYFGVHSNFPFGKDDFHDGMLVLHMQLTKSPYSLNIPFDLTKPLRLQDEETFFKPMSALLLLIPNA